MAGLGYPARSRDAETKKPPGGGLVRCEENLGQEGDAPALFIDGLAPHIEDRPQGYEVTVRMGSARAQALPDANSHKFHDYRSASARVLTSVEVNT